jgi:hypothetical protein
VRRFVTRERERRGKGGGGVLDGSQAEMGKKMCVCGGGGSSAWCKRRELGGSRPAERRGRQGHGVGRRRTAPACVARSRGGGGMRRK